MPVGGQVGEPGGGIGQQVPGDDQDGVADRYQRTLLAAAPGDPEVAGSEDGLGPAQAWLASDRIRNATVASITPNSSSQTPRTTTRATTEIAG